MGKPGEFVLLCVLNCQHALTLGMQAAHCIREMTHAKKDGEANNTEKHQLNSHVDQVRNGRRHVNPLLL